MTSREATERTTLPSVREPRQSTDWRLALFLGIVLVALMILVKGSLRSPIESSVYQRLSSSDGYGTNLLTAFPSLRTQLLGKRGLVIMLGPCSSCTVSKYQRGQELKGRFEYVLEVYDSQDSSDLPASDGLYLVVKDADGVLHRELKAFQPPRAYETDREGCIVLAGAGLSGSFLIREDSNHATRILAD